MNTPTQIIEDELAHIARRLQTHLARGNWAKAYECDIEAHALRRLKTRLAENEQATTPRA